MRKIGASLLLVATAAGAFAQQAGGANLKAALSQGLGAYLVACFSGGLLALLTPCVFPMAPVTIAFFSKRTHKPIVSALVYALGIIATFAVLGVGTSLIFGATGIERFATNPWVNVALAVVFIAMALNLFGVYEVNFGFAGKLSERERRDKQSLWAPAVVGMAFSLTSFTCTGPIVAGLLLLAAKGGSPATAVLGMTAFGIAFSLPFLVLALFPSALAKLPRSGEWLSAVKPALGFIELAASIKFLSNADLVWQLGWLKRPVFLVLWGAIAVGLAVYLIGLFQPKVKPGWVRRGLGVAAGVLGIWMLTHLGGKGLDSIDAYLPPAPYPSKGAPVGGNDTGPTALTWAQTYKEALAKAQTSGKSVFVDFTGVTCTNCRWMEANVFPIPEVHKLLASMISVQLYTDRGTAADQANQALQQKIGGTIALPVYVVVRPDGSVVKTFEGAARNPQEFIDFLKVATSGSAT